MKKLIKFFLPGPLTFIFLIGFAVYAYVQWQADFSERSYPMLISPVPVDIGVTDVVERYHVPYDPSKDQKVCYVTVLKLDDRTSSEISEKGLDFLKLARTGRGNKIQYNEWRSSPVTKEDSERPDFGGRSLEDECSPDMSRKLKGRLRQALSSDAKAYYTLGPKHTLLIIPEMNIVAVLVHE